MAGVRRSQLALREQTGMSPVCDVLGYRQAKAAHEAAWPRRTPPFEPFESQFLKDCPMELIEREFMGGCDCSSWGLALYLERFIGFNMCLDDAPPTETRLRGGRR